MRSRVHVVRGLPAADYVTIERLLDDPASWLPPPAHPIGMRTYRVELHAGGASQVADVTVGATRILPEAFERMIAWRPEGAAAAVLPAFTGHVRLREDIGVVQLEVEGEYTPPVGVVGALADRVALHRVADRTVQRLVDDMAANLGRDTSPTP